MYFFESLYEQQMPTQQMLTPTPTQQMSAQPVVQQQQSPEEFDNMPLEDNNLEDPTDLISIPIKRYYLMQKLHSLNNKLNQLRIKNTVLSIVISFIDSFSYENLLAISNKLIEEIQMQVKSAN